MIVSMIQEAIAKHELKPEFDEAFIIKVVSHPLLEFDQIFVGENDNKKGETLTNLKYYAKFIKYGFKA